MKPPETGPVYGVQLIETLPLGTGAMLQRMASRQDLEDVRCLSERTVAAYEVLMSHYQKTLVQVELLEAELNTLKLELSK